MDKAKQEKGGSMSEKPILTQEQLAELQAEAQTLNHQKLVRLFPIAVEALMAAIARADEAEECAEEWEQFAIDEQKYGIALMHERDHYKALCEEYKECQVILYMYGGPAGVEAIIKRAEALERFITSFHSVPCQGCALDVDDCGYDAKTHTCPGWQFDLPRYSSNKGYEQ